MDHFGKTYIGGIHEEEVKLAIETSVKTNIIIPQTP